MNSKSQFWDTLEDFGEAPALHYDNQWVSYSSLARESDDWADKL